jgi:transcription initiation factor TFIIIB Brf1 subunit/transcription initiation factor TFIIB
MTNLFTIIDAWRIANNPTKTQAELAKKRALICDTCPSKKTITKLFGEIGIVCNECGCPIAKKVFTPKNKQCPLNKWEKVEAEYYSNSGTHKGTKTML